MASFVIKTVISFPDGTETHRSDAIDTGVLKNAGNAMFHVQTVTENLTRGLMNDTKLKSQLETLKAVK